MLTNICDSVYRLRIVALIEGVSFLLLIFVTMPLKYYMGMRDPNIYIGYAHGVLFIIYIIFALETLVRRKIELLQFVRVFIASIIPFGTFFNDKMLKEQQEKFAITKQ